MDMTQEIRDLLKDLSKMDSESQKQLKDEVASISAWTATQIKHAASDTPYPKQSERIAESIKFNRDRVPNVTIGGSKGRFSGGSAGAKGGRSGDVLFGNEFGAYPTSEGGRFPNGGRRFPFRTPIAPSGKGNTGYWIFPTMRSIQPELSRRWWTAADKIFRHWQRS